MRMAKGSLCVTALLLLGVAGGRPVMAQQQGVPLVTQGVSPVQQYDLPAGAREASVASPETYGTASLIISPVNSFGFVPFDSATQYWGDGLNGRYTLSGGTCYEAPAMMPTGAVLRQMAVEWCDSDSSHDMSFTLYICSSGACDVRGPFTTTGLANGCWVSTGFSGDSVQVNNLTTTYTLEVCTGGSGPSLLFRNARVYYQLQVSPAPATATFTDVPTAHPFFRFVEALAASGITGGCGGGNYCPDSPITRGQMAVFLASALGLHFPL